MGITLDEAIKHIEEVANANERLCETVSPAMQLSDYDRCAKEHRQLAEWLKDYKRLLEQQPCNDTVSKETVIEWLKNKDIIKTKNQEENARRELATLSSVIS